MCDPFDLYGGIWDFKPRLEWVKVKRTWVPQSECKLIKGKWIIKKTSKWYKEEKPKKRKR